MRKINFFVIAVIFLATFGIAVTNYQPGTFLTGWDNVHSEFNVTQHITRALNSVWQDYEATGTTVGVGDASDLPRLLFLWIFSWMLPLSIVRYFFHFLMLFVGVMGAYLAIKSFFIDRKGKIADIAPLFGALFYLLNLGTLQYFATPFEPFSLFWGLFPWLMLSTFRYLTKPTRKNLGFFALIHLLATPIFYVATTFYIYVIVLCILFGSHFLTQRTKQTFRTIVTAFFVFLFVNAFWLFPHFYWVINNRSVQQNAILNKLVTQDVYQQVGQFGDLSDFMLLRNKPWDYHDFSHPGENFLLQPWHNHFGNSAIPVIGYILFVIVLCGIFTTKFQRIFLIGFSVVSFLLLANTTPVAREFNYLFRQIDILNQVFRDPFTKIIVPTIFVFSIGFSGGIVLLYRLLPTRLRKPVSVVGASALIIALFIYAWPVYTGNFIANKMKVSTPNYYFDFFNFMRQQDATQRIANFPQGSVWGWANNNWGYTGSGFLWHGLRQPVLDPAFNVWNDKNEEYYWEVTYALNKKDYTLLNAVFRKYNISYVMFDSSVFFPDNPNSVFSILRQKEFIEKNPELKKIASFGTIDLYQTLSGNKNTVAIITDPVTVQTQTNWVQNDKAYLDYGTYVAQKRSQNGVEVSYPFRSLFSGRGTEDITYTTSQNQKSFTIHAVVPDGKIVFPPVVEEEFIQFDKKDLSTHIKKPQVKINNKEIPISSEAAITHGELTIDVDMDDRYGSYNSASDSSQFIGIDSKCGTQGQGKVSYQSVVKDTGEGQFVLFSTTKNSSCRTIYLPELFYKSGYLVAIKSRNVKGSTLRFWVENHIEKRSDQQLYLKKQSKFGWEYFIIPPMAQDGVGYSLHFDNVSIGSNESANDLAQVILYPIPYQFLTGMKVVTGQTPTVSVTNTEALTSVSHPVFSTYSVQLDQEKIQEKDTITLYQSYDKGWNAYVVDGWWGRTFPLLFGKKLTQHVMVNNWANGWIIEGKPQTIALVFWPQYLEYFGFVLLPLPFIYAFWPRNKRRRETEIQ